MLRLSFVAAALHRHPGWFNLIPNLSSRAPRTDLFFAPLFWRAVRAERDLSSSLVVSRPSNFASRAGCWPRPVEPSKSAPEARKNLAPRLSADTQQNHRLSAVGAALSADGVTSPHPYFNRPYTSTSPRAPIYTRPSTTTGITNRVANAARSRVLFCSEV